MKKLLILLLLISSCFQVNAQISLGVKAGFNYANFIDNTNDPNTSSFEAEYKIAYHLGLVSDFELSDKASLSTELLLSNKGSKDGSLKIALLYLNIPILINYHFTDKLSAHAGPELGVKLSSQIKLENSSDDISNLFDQSFDLGASLGLNFQVTEKFLLTLRYTRGLLTLIDVMYYRTINSPNYVKIQSNVYNSNFQLSLSYLLHRNS